MESPGRWPMDLKSHSLPFVNNYAVTVVGHDRPGIVADVTGALATHGGNIEDSSMTLLRGYFAWTLVVALDTDIATVESTLAPLEQAHLKIAVVELAPEVSASAAPTHWLSVHGSDRPGIVSAVTAVVAGVGGNITDLTTRLAGTLYVVLADVFLPPGVDIDSLSQQLLDVATELGVDVSLRVADDDDVL
jgi:glycine cleavage system transcriptional repressor